MVRHPCMEREYHVSTRPTASPPTHAGLGSSLNQPSRRREDRAPPCHLPTTYITSRASAGECSPRKVVLTLIPPALSQHSEPEPRTARVLRVTAAPAPSYVGRVVHDAALRGQAMKGGLVVSCEGASQLAACSGVVLGWVYVYSTTGCTADNSRVESGAWWPTC
jgi:hypothetical protein